MSEFFFRVHWTETNAFGDHLASNLISTEADDVDTAQAAITAATPNLVSITHVGTINDPGK